ncbi:NAD(P)-dependent oxidoreductase [Pseudomonas sp. RC4D1]|uniref:NAD(P)-dependent oxidoreductase n=1 Tax=Pseudomonas sp. RC4D1 TaxID=2834407 RepID=UPI001BCBBFEB|nr:NAD(P)-binding domain-containing protein [Pseudomonas sp. RC4D1]MBS7560104.1 NAD(P)-dependent oxidoreductase [Pseudomonas sp. RC4D1]
MQSEVTVIGLGAMGSALAHVLLRAGKRVTVWNRSLSRTESAAGAGAHVSETFISAISASPVCLFCVDNYAVTNALLTANDIEGVLSGKLLVQLSTGDPQEARDSEEWALSRGADYLDAAILAFPAQMGTQEATIIVSGALASFERGASILKLLAPNLSYLGDRVGAASAQDCAVAAYFSGALLGALHGARICEVEGLPVDEYCSLLADISPVLGGDIQHMGAMIHSESYSTPQASLKTWAAAISRLERHAKAVKINHEFPAFASALFRLGVDAGYGSEEVAALIKVLRAVSEVR